MNISKVDFSSLASRWPSTFVARQHVGRFSGGILDPKYMANLDCQGKGIKNRIRIGRKIAYPVKDLIKFLESRSEIVN
ncbi:MAG: hypothetical protein JRF25_12120 [Deltaproteobacteria bacterium]|nr:hypothetical protein [Deltaproteobacteria bacterium]